MDLSESKHRIFIAECKTLMREGLRAMFSSHPSYEVAGEASDGLSVVRAIEKIRPDLILLELDLPKMSGVAVLRNIRKQMPEARITVLALHNNEDYLTELFKHSNIKKNPVSSAITG
jgi:DNA-binding NarL/FixJ family response regulator